jgi:hypothetical protein
MLKRLRAGWSAFEEFWLGGDVRVSLRVLHILWALAVLHDIFYTWAPSLPELLLPSSVFRGVTDPIYLRWWNIFAYVDGELPIRVGLGVLIVSLFLVIVRVRPLRSAILSVYLLSCFHHLLPHIFLAQYSAIRFAGFCLIFSASARPAWVLRLLQFQISILYLSAALYQLQYVPWLTGEVSLLALQLNTANPVLRDFVSDYVSWRFIFRLVSWSAVLGEIFCAVGLWFKPSRKFALAVGALYNIALVFLIREPELLLVMFFGLAAFVDWKELFAPVRTFSVHILPARVFSRRHAHPTKRAG